MPLNVNGNNIVDSSEPFALELDSSVESGESYSQVEHLASIAFPFSYKRKYMLMLTAYLDETGHSADNRQKFVGMGGLIAPSKNWQRFERNWKNTLRRYSVPCLHMKDFAHSAKDFKKWKNNEPIRREFLGELMQIIKDAQALPFGCSIPMDFYKPHPTYLQDSVKNPYYFAFMLCSIIISHIAEHYRMQGETVASVFAEQTEFQNTAMRMYQGLKRDGAISDLVDSPIFRPIDKFVPLQAADFVAYEVQKESYRMLYEPNKKPRWGWKQLASMQLVGQEKSGFVFPNEQNLIDFMAGIKLSIMHNILGLPKQ